MRLARNKERGSNNKTNLRTSYKHRPYHTVVGGHGHQIEGEHALQLIDVVHATVNLVELEKRRLILHLDQPNPARGRHCWNKKKQQDAGMRPVTD